MTDLRLLRLGFRSPEDVRRAMVPRKLSRGRAGLPKHAVSAMYLDYQRLGSLAKVGKIYGRTRQAVYDIFRGHRLPCRPRNFRETVEWNGRKFAPVKNEYLRETSGERELLHKLIWKSLHGEIPAGHQVTFKDGNKLNIAPENLLCLPIAEVSLFHYRRRFPDRAGMSEAERREYWKKYQREAARVKAAAYVAKGLRCDGRPRRGRPSSVRRRQRQTLTSQERLALIA